MGHLEDVEMSYWQHLKLASFNSLRLLFSSVVLFIHGICPCLFTNTASAILKDVLKSFPKTNNRILVRFNTKWQNDPDKRQWRVLVNGVESLAHKVVIKTTVTTIEEEVAGEQKFHFLCYGQVLWQGTNAEII
jgi:hypothetical protein